MKSWATQREENDDLDTMPSLVYTGVLGIGLTERTQTFVEFFGKTSTIRGGGPENGFDTGVAFLVTDRFQLDTSVGWGVSEAAFDWFVSAGFGLLVF